MTDHKEKINRDCTCFICKVRKMEAEETNHVADSLKIAVEAMNTNRPRSGLEAQFDMSWKINAPKEKSVKASDLLGKQVRYKLKAKDKGILTVVAVYDARYKNYEHSKDNVRVKNANGSMWTTHSDELVEVKEIKSYAFVDRRGAVIYFATEEQGYEEVKFREKSEMRKEGLGRHDQRGQSFLLTRASEYDQHFGDKKV